MGRVESTSPVGTGAVGGYLPGQKDFDVGIG